MSKLSELVSAAKAATPGPWRTDQHEHDCPHQDIDIRNGLRSICTVWIDDACYDENGQRESNANFIALANPATILELCALLEKAEEALDGCLARLYGELYPNHPETLEVEEALAAIKQWKEKADAIRGGLA